MEEKLPWLRRKPRNWHKAIALTFAHMVRKLHSQICGMKRLLKHWKQSQSWASGQGYASDASDFSQAVQLVNEVMHISAPCFFGNNALYRDNPLMRMSEAEWAASSGEPQSAFN
jgi:hypothetical protein